MAGILEPRLGNKETILRYSCRAYEFNSLLGKAQFFPEEVPHLMSDVSYKFIDSARRWLQLHQHCARICIDVCIQNGDTYRYETIYAR